MTNPPTENELADPVTTGLLRLLQIGPEVDVIVEWGNPQPIRLAMTSDTVDLEEIEMIYGGPLIPLCNRQIPSKGCE